MLNSELLDRLIGQVHHRRADGLIGDVHAIHLNTGRTPERPPTETPVIWFLVGSKSPPSTIWTPGASCAKSRKLRPFGEERQSCWR